MGIGVGLGVVFTIGFLVCLFWSGAVKCNEGPLPLTAVPPPHSEIGAPPLTVGQMGGESGGKGDSSGAPQAAP